MNNLINELPDFAKTIYRITFRNVMSKYNNESLADSIALGAVQTEFVRINDIWQERSDLNNFQVVDGMWITKAVYKDDRMLWQATASDTGKDVFQERMSTRLYKSFIHNQDGSEYVSLAHYPSLDGYSEFGKPDTLYIDGEKFKSKGFFNNDEKGIALYNAVRKDRRDNIPQDERIRVSIGFWDYLHSHGDLGEWSYKSGVPCAMCATGIKDKVYLEGKLNHLAMTRVPARTTTSIDVVE